MSSAQRVGATVVAVPAWVLATLIVGYRRFITPYTPATCRFYPTCSSYGLTAVRTHGALKGTALTVWRVLRCHPWTPGGVDHVPPRGHWRAPAQVTPEGAGEPAPAPSSPPSEPRPLVGPSLPPSTGA